jgi:protein SCO1/2
MNSPNKVSGPHIFPNPTVLSISLVFAAVLMFPSCTSRPAPKRYQFTGQIMSIDKPSQSAIIDGDNVPGFMSAMTMSYKIKPASMLSQLAAGDLISADALVIQPAHNSGGPSDYWLENVKVIGHAKISSPSPGPGAAQRMPQPGDVVPDFSFTNQDGQRVSLKQYRGKVLFLTFIYTQCPFPDFCPCTSANFAEIYKQVETDHSLESSTRLLSLTFDPQHDTPKVRGCSTRKMGA